MNVELVKGGDNICSLTLSRPVRLSRKGYGVTLSVKAHPLIEEFFRENSHNRYRPIDVWSNVWASTDDSVLNIYETGPELSGPLSHGGTVFRFDRVGMPLALTTEIPVSVNLSFLRIAGISQPTGVTFAIRGVMSTDAMREIRDHLLKGVSAFYSGHIRPIDFCVSVVTQEFMRPLT